MRSITVINFRLNRTPGYYAADQCRENFRAARLWHAPPTGGGDPTTTSRSIQFPSGANRAHDDRVEPVRKHRFRFPRIEVRGLRDALSCPGHEETVSVDFIRPVRDEALALEPAPCLHKSFGDLAWVDH